MIPLHPFWQGFLKTCLALIFLTALGVVGAIVGAAIHRGSLTPVEAFIACIVVIGSVGGLVNWALAKWPG